MLGKRILAVAVMLAIGIPAILAGGVYLSSMVALLLGLAAWEYGRMFKLIDLNASQPILVAGVVVLVLARAHAAHLAGSVLSVLVLAAMTWHLILYERGRERAGSDFALTIGGLVYLGWIGAYLVELRNLPDGLWWLLISLPITWAADTGAYFIGQAFGKTPLSPRLSPRKTWEGYWGGVALGTLAGPGLVLLYRQFGGPDIPLWQGLVLGLVLSTLPTLGDLGESMFKREAGIKDSSHILPGHGGVFDRIDSWLWAGALGYFLVHWIFPG